MSHMPEVLHWMFGAYNLPFLIPLGIALALVCLEVVTGGLSELVSIDLDGDGEIDVDVDGDGEFGFLSGLGWLGFGKAPISVLIEVMCASFGLTGLLVTAIGNDLVGTAGSWVLLVIALPLAFVVSIITTRVVGLTIHKYIPNSSTTVKLPGAYVGQTGRTMGLVNEKAGQVQVKNEGDAPVLLNAYAITLLPPGMEVVLDSYDPDKKRYEVHPVKLFAE